MKIFPTSYFKHIKDPWPVTSTSLIKIANIGTGTDHADII